MEDSSHAHLARGRLLWSSVGNPVPVPDGPAASGWDIEFTRLSGKVLRRVQKLVQELAARFGAAGLECDVRVRQTPRGLSTYLAVVGQRGLLFIVDMTLIDGLAVARLRGACLDIRLLDGCGDPAVHCSPHSLDDVSAFRTTLDEIMAEDQIGPCATTICLLAMGHFGLIAAATPGTERSIT